jgi:hypothetical protein
MSGGRFTRRWPFIVGAVGVLGAAIAVASRDTAQSSGASAQSAAAAKQVVASPSVGVASAPPAPAAASTVAPSTPVPTVGAADARSLLAALERGNPTGEHTDAQIDRVIAWLRATPGGAAALREWLRTENGRYDTGAVWPRIVLAALGAVGGPEARTALRSLAAERALSQALRLHAVMHLGRTADVEATDVEALVALAAERAPTPGAHSDMVASGALSTLGAVAREGRLEDEAARTRALSVVRAALTTEVEPAYLTAAVNAAAASADASLLPALEPLAAHADRDVRAALATGLAQLEGGTEAPWALAWARRETVSRVRAALAEAAAEGGADQSWTDWAVGALPTERGTAARALVTLIGAAAEAGSEPARDALVARFTAEQRLGAMADRAVLDELGRHLDTTTLAKAIAAGSLRQ